MEVFKKVKVKLIIATVFVILTNFIMPNIAFAEGESTHFKMSGGGGSIAQPIFDFVTFVGDALLTIMQKTAFNGSDLYLEARSNSHRYVNGWGVVGIIAGAVGLIVGIALIVTGVGAPAGASVVATIFSVAAAAAKPLIIGGVLTYLGASAVITGLSGEYELPTIQYTPFAIFSNKIPLFDINFFNPDIDNYNIEKAKEEISKIKDNKIQTIKGLLDEAISEGHNVETRTQEKLEEDNKKIQSSAAILQATVSRAYQTCRLIAVVGLLSILVYIAIRIILSSTAPDKAKYKERLKDWLVAMCLVFVIHYLMVAIITVCQEVSNQLANACQENILVLLPADTQVKTTEDVIIKLGNMATEVIPEEEPENSENEELDAVTVQTTIIKEISEEMSESYYLTLARIVHNKIQNGESSFLESYFIPAVQTELDAAYNNFTAEEKDKASQMEEKLVSQNVEECAELIIENTKKSDNIQNYKKYNWFEGVFTRLEEKLEEYLDDQIELDQVNINNQSMFWGMFTSIKNDYMTAPANSTNIKQFLYGVYNHFWNGVNIEIDSEYDESNTPSVWDWEGNEDGMGWIQLPEQDGYCPLYVNFLEYIRLMIEEKESSDLLLAVGYVVIYLALVILTIIFTAIYLKRVIYMAFLTMIAPLVAMTYPLDKIHDGQAQGFTTWIREYIFNALMQPIHLMLYTMVIGTVMGLVADYPLYAVIALGFMLPAEKFIRQMFGFNKAQTPGALGTMGLAGTTLLMSGMNKLLHRPPVRDDDENDNGEKKIKFLKVKGDLLTGGSNTQATSNGGGNPPIIPPGGSGGGNPPITPTGGGGGENPPITSIGGSGGENPLTAQQNGEELLNTEGTNWFNDVLQHQRREAAEESPNNSQAQQLTDKEKIKKKFKNGLDYARLKQYQRYTRKIKKSHPIRKLRRGITFGAGAAALGLLGLAAGVASGSPGKAMSYAGAAGAAGGAAAKSIGNAATKDLRAKGNDYLEGYRDEDDKRKRAVNELMMDPDIAMELKQKAEKRNVDYNTYRKEYEKYANYGVTDVKEFDAAYQMEKDFEKRFRAQGLPENKVQKDAFERAMLVRKASKRMGNLLDNPERQEAWRKQLKETYLRSEEFTSSIRQINQNESSRVSEASHHREEEISSAQEEIDNISESYRQEEEIAERAFMEQEDRLDREAERAVETEIARLNSETEAQNKQIEVQEKEIRQKEAKRRAEYKSRLQKRAGIQAGKESINGGDEQATLLAGVVRTNIENTMAKYDERLEKRRKEREQQHKENQREREQFVKTAIERFREEQEEVKRQRQQTFESQRAEVRQEFERNISSLNSTIEEMQSERNNMIRQINAEAAAARNQIERRAENMANSTVNDAMKFQIELE